MTTEVQPRAEPEQIADPRPGERWAIVALALSSLLSALGTSVANVALPTLVTSFGASFEAVQWVVLAYLLAITSSIVGVGRLGDVLGRRRLLVSGLALYATASVVGGIAPELPLVIGARAGQGLGAACMMALTLAFVGDVVPRARTGSAMGLLGTVSAVGTALGPSVGGVLLASAGWRAIFLLQAPPALVALVLALRHLPEDRAEATTKRVRFDHVGTALLAATLMAYALAVTGAPGRAGGVHLGLLGAAALGAGIFLIVESKAAEPLFRVSMLRDAVLGTSLATSALVATVVMTTLVVGPFYLSRTLGLTAASVGLVLSIGPFVAALAGVPAGRLVDRFGPSSTVLAGLAGMATGASVLAIAPESLGIGGYVLPIAVVTGSYALFQAGNNTAVLQDAGHDRGVASGLLNLARNLGLITGAAVMGAVFASATGTNDLTTASPVEIATGMRTTFGTATVLLGVALVLGAAGRTSATRRARSLAGWLAIALAAWSTVDARAVEPAADEPRGNRREPGLPAVRTGDIGVWGGQSLTVDFRRPGRRVGAMAWFDLAERTLGSTWQSMVRPGVGVVGRVGRTDLSLAAGYGLGTVHRDGSAWEIEHRLWQLIQSDTRLSAENPIRLTGRVRLEERFLPGSGGLQLRLRGLVRGLLPIGRSGWGLSLWDEAFARVDVPHAGFDQNRFFAGPYFQSSQGVRVEVGYLYLLAARPDVDAGRHTLLASHVAPLQFTVGVKAFASERAAPDLGGRLRDEAGDRVRFRP